MAERAIPIAVCEGGERGAKVAAVLQAMLDQAGHSVIVFNRPARGADLLLAHLTIGLHSKDAHLVGSNPPALRVRVHQLRERGFIIESIPDAPTTVNPAVTYRLRSAPE